MKNRLWFTLSIAVNVVLLGALFWTRSPSLDSPTTGAAATSSPHEPIRAKAAAVDTTRAQPLDWTESMAQFRNAGVPSAILAKLVVEKIALKWTPLEKQFEEQYLNDVIDAKRLAELHDQRANEQEQELRLALGDGYDAWHKQSTVDNMYLGGLQPTDAQRDALYPLQKDYLKGVHDLEIAKRNGRLDEKAFADAHAELELDYKNKLVGIIGADRVDGLPGSEDPEVRVRRDFSRLQLTDAQTKELVAVQQKWSDIHAAMGKLTEEKKTIEGADAGDLQAIDRARDEELRRILGPEAFDSWQKTRDARYATLQRNAQTWNLSPQQIDAVYSAVRAYDLAAASYEHQAQVQEQQGQLVDWQAVAKGMSAYTQQTAAALRNYLGDERFEHMQKSQIFGFRRAISADHDANSRPFRP